MLNQPMNFTISYKTTLQDEVYNYVTHPEISSGIDEIPNIKSKYKTILS